MKIKSGGYVLTGLVVAAAIVFFDQYTKYLVMENLLRVTGDKMSFGAWLVTEQSFLKFFLMESDYRPVKLTSFLNFVMVWNTGISFGMFGDGGDNARYLLIALTAAVATALSAWMYVAQRRSLVTALALIVGGAIGNIIDRLRFGAVADFVDVHVAGYHWPAFNLADSAIVIGAAFLILDTFLYGEPERKTEKEK